MSFLNGTKSLFASRTIQGLIISMALRSIGVAFGIDFADGELAQGTELVFGLIAFALSFAGDAMAWWGRVRATRQIATR